MNNSLELLKVTKGKDLTIGMLVNVWLEEFFGIVLDDLKTDNRFYKKNGDIKDNGTRKFYKVFAVSQEQHDFWEELMFDILPNKLKISKKFFKHSWPMTYLNCAPSIKYKK